jgi:nitrate reductase NapE component
MPFVVLAISADIKVADWSRQEPTRYKGVSGGLDTTAFGLRPTLYGYVVGGFGFLVIHSIVEDVCSDFGSPAPSYMDVKALALSGS